MLKDYIYVFLVLCFLEGCKTISIEQTPDVDVEQKTLNTQKTLIMHYLDVGKSSEAYMEARKILKQYPDDPELLNLIGLSLLALRKPHLAIEHFRKSYSISLQPATALNISAALLELKNYSEAIKFLKNFLKNHKNYIYKERVYHNIGVAYESLKQYNLAEQYYRKAIDENPAYIITIVKLGKLYQNINKIDVAAQKFEDALYKCPNCYDPLESLVYVLKRTNKPDQAKKIILQYLANKGIRAEDHAKAISLLKTIDASYK